MRSVLLACTILSAAAACGATEYVGIQMSEPPKPPDKPAEVHPAPKMTREQREAIGAAAKAADEREEYIRTVIHNILVAEYQKRTTVPPEKDEYRRYLQEMARRDEAQSDPDVAKIRAQYRDEDAGDDFRKWKHSGAYAHWKAVEPKENKAAPEAPAEADRKSTRLLWEFLKGTLKPREPARAKVQDEEAK
ncbi:MAG: hypothetical protein HY291_05895 [Planctomycetes bacterium]|nr:hypothetical protein [Planctomycetota bacterium]